MAEKPASDAPQPTTQAVADTEADKAVAAVRALIEDNPVTDPAPAVTSNSAGSTTVTSAATKPALQKMPEATRRQDVAPHTHTYVAPAPAPDGKHTPRRSFARKAATKSRDLSRLLIRFTGQMLRHPMTPRVLAALACLTAVVLYPLMTLALLFVLVLTGVIVYLSLGPERVEGFAARRFEKLQKRDPERAEVLRKRAIRVVAILTKGIDVLPERWTSGLYLPDFEDSSIHPDRLSTDPFERLAPETKAMAKAALDHDLDQALRRPSAREPRAAGKEYQYRRL